MRRGRVWKWMGREGGSGWGNRVPDTRLPVYLSLGRVDDGVNIVLREGVAGYGWVGIGAGLVLIWFGGGRLGEAWWTYAWRSGAAVWVCKERGGRGVMVCW